VAHRGNHQIIKNRLTVFKRGENLLQNSVLHFVLRLNQLPEIKLQRIYEFTQMKNWLFWKGLRT